jgi:hypothetical protein
MKVKRMRTSVLPVVCDEYVESFQEHAAFSRERMSPANARAFGDAVRSVVEPYSSDAVELQIISEVVWGKPLARSGDG